MLNNRKRRPTHPGEILREDVLPAAGLTQDKLARLLGVSRRTVSEILHERRPVTTDMAHRLARFRHVSGDVARPTAGCRSLEHPA
jgi:addiction module HigA family antidote